MSGALPEWNLRAAIVLRELYDGLPAERVARAYVLVTEEAERRANGLIAAWLELAYRDGYEKAREVQAQQEEAETKAFLEQARTVTRIVEVGTAREEAAQRRGEGEDYPGGRVEWVPSLGYSTAYPEDQGSAQGPTEGQG